ncbi:M48 family metallopeptidase [Acholeplasma sp. OttesenSCG-928-E16]|nr:M48 family metallopeptidase [Acholeplasma sp. OttesenSCG-928-E16]
MDELLIGNTKIKYKIVIKNIKRTYFRVKEDYVLVTTNKYQKKSDIIDFIKKRSDRFIRIINEKNEEKPFTLWGKEYNIIQQNSSKFRYHIFENEIYLYSNKTINEAIKQLLKKEIIKKYNDIKNEIEDKICKMNLKLLKTNFRFLKSRYGSCNLKTKEITINSFLARIDIIYFKYVLFHEYAHLIEPNHQKPFYEVLDHFMINHKEIQKRLKKIAIY